MSNNAVEVRENLLVKAIDAAIAAGKIGQMPTLRSMAAVFGMNPQRIYAVAKTPKEGEIYDARVFNMDAIEKFVTKRLTDDMDMVAFVDAAIEKDKEYASQDRRTARRIPDGEKYVKYSGGLMPKRKWDLEVGKRILLKKDRENVYIVVLVSDTHVVIAPETYPTEYKVMANWTLNTGMISPFRFDETLEARQAEAAAAKEPKKTKQQSN